MFQKLLLVSLCMQILSASEISGPYSDGWIGAEVSFSLLQVSAVSPLVVQGMIPTIGSLPFSPEITILDDGREIVKQKIGPGLFEIRSFGDGMPGVKNITIRIDELRQLPMPDGRRIGARLTQVGFESLNKQQVMWRVPGEAISEIIPLSGPFGLGAGWSPCETSHGESFRWIGQEAQISVFPGLSLAARITAEPGPSLHGNTCLLRLESKSGRLIDKISISKRGSYDLIIPAMGEAEQPLRLLIDGPVLTSKNGDPVLGLRVMSLLLQQ